MREMSIVSSEEVVFVVCRALIIPIMACFGHYVLSIYLPDALSMAGQTSENTRKHVSGF